MKSIEQKQNGIEKVEKTELLKTSVEKTLESFHNEREKKVSELKESGTQAEEKVGEIEGSTTEDQENVKKIVEESNEAAEKVSSEAQATLSGGKKKGFFKKTWGVLTKQRGVKQIDKPTTRLEKTRNILNDPEIGNQVAKTGVKTIASITCIKGIYDVPAYFRQKFMVRGMFGKGKGLKGSMEQLMTASQEMKEEGVEKGSVHNAIQDLNKRLKLTKEGSEKNSEARKKLAEMLKANRHQEEIAKAEVQKQITELLDKKINTKITGMQATREGLNTLCAGFSTVTFGASMMARPIAYTGMDAVARYKELQKGLSEGESVNIVKDVLIGGITKVVKEAQGIDIEGKGLSGKQRALKAVGAWGKILRHVGIASTAMSGDSMNNLLDAFANPAEAAKGTMQNLTVENIYDGFENRVEGVWNMPGKIKDMSEKVWNKLAEEAQSSGVAFVETPPVVSVIPTEETSSLNFKESIGYQGGKSVWQEAEKQLEGRFGDTFKELDGDKEMLAEALKTYNIDDVKDAIVDDPTKYGLSEDIDFSKMSAEQIKGIKWDEAFKDTFGKAESGKLTEQLTESQVGGIVESNMAEAATPVENIEIATDLNTSGTLKDLEFTNNIETEGGNVFQEGNDLYISTKDGGELIMHKGEDGITYEIPRYADVKASHELAGFTAVPADPKARFDFFKSLSEKVGKIDKLKIETGAGTNEVVINVIDKGKNIQETIKLPDNYSIKKDTSLFEEDPTNQKVIVTTPNGETIHTEINMNNTGQLHPTDKKLEELLEKNITEEVVGEKNLSINKEEIKPVEVESLEPSEQISNIKAGKLAMDNELQKHLEQAGDNKYEISQAKANYAHKNMNLFDKTIDVYHNNNIPLHERISIMKEMIGGEGWSVTTMDGTKFEVKDDDLYVNFAKIEPSDEIENTVANTLDVTPIIAEEEIVKPVDTEVIKESIEPKISSVPQKEDVDIIEETTSQPSGGLNSTEKYIGANFEPLRIEKFPADKSEVEELIKNATTGGETPTHSVPYLKGTFLEGKREFVAIKLNPEGRMLLEKEGLLRSRTYAATEIEGLRDNTYNRISPPTMRKVGNDIYMIQAIERNEAPYIAEASESKVADIADQKNPVKVFEVKSSKQAEGKEITNTKTKITNARKEFVNEEGQSVVQKTETRFTKNTGTSYEDMKLNPDNINLSENTETIKFAGEDYIKGTDFVAYKVASTNNLANDALQIDAFVKGSGQYENPMILSDKTAIKVVNGELFAIRKVKPSSI